MKVESCCSKLSGVSATSSSPAKFTHSVENCNYPEVIDLDLGGKWEFGR